MSSTRFIKTCFAAALMFLSLTSAKAGPGVTTPYIKIDQFGYFCNARKVAVVVDPQTGYNSAESFNPGTAANQYQLRRWSDDVAVFTGTLQVWNSGATHAQSGDKGWYFDFTSYTTAGSYYVYDLTNNVGSYRFDIGDNVYNDALKHALRMFYYQRINFAKATPYAGANWTDGEWFSGPNQDYAARSRYDKTNPATARDLHGGWFDAGDQNKYTTFAREPILELLEAYRMNPSVFTDNLNIPESGNGIPDLLDEVKYELDFLKRMQDGTGTNGLFIKIGVDNYNTVSPPSLDTRPRYYVGECTSATLSGAAMFSLAGIVYSASSNPTLQAYGADLLTRAANAWTRAQTTTANFTTFETSCDDGDIKSGDADEQANWQLEAAVTAAIYLYEATGNATYKNFVESKYTQCRPYVENYWSPYNAGISFALLKYASLPNVNTTVANNIRNMKAGMNYLFSIDNYNAGTDLYRSHMEDWAYHWGSNEVKCNAGNNNLDFNTFSINTNNTAAYREVAEQYLHWFHGINPMGMVMLSNMYAYGAEKCANEIYHSWFDNGTPWDNALTSQYGPAPGYIVGGSNKDFSVPSIVPPGGQPPQKAYKDWNTGYPESSWEITEPAIYSQAAYIRLLTRLMTANNCNATAVPATPAALTATSVSTTQINLAWTDNATTETTYSVERATAAAGPWTVLSTTLPANTTAYSATGLSGGTTYYFRVRCSDGVNYSSYSNTANATTASAAVPAAPTGLSANPGSSTDMVLRWTDNANNETTYKVERAAAVNGPWTEIAGNLPANTVLYTASGLTAATNYFFRVRCANTNGNSAYSASVKAKTTANNLPGKPTNLVATAVSSTQINLTWWDNATNETAYRIDRAPTATGPWAALATNLPANTSSYSNTGLAAGTAYYYRVRCSNANGNSAVSNTANATTTTAPAAVAVYSDALASGWADWSWSSTNNFANTTPVQAGTKSISTTFTAGWAGLSLRNSTVLTTSSYSAIKFWVHGGSGANKSLLFYTQATESGAASTGVTFTATAGTWTEITITPAQLGNPAGIQRLNFQNNTPDAQTAIYFDNIRLIPTTGFNAPTSGMAGLMSTVTTLPASVFYPNPVTGTGTLAFISDKEQVVDISIFDLAGRKAAHQSYQAAAGGNTLEFDWSGYRPGIYFLLLQMDGRQETLKVVRE